MMNCKKITISAVLGLAWLLGAAEPAAALRLPEEIAKERGNWSVFVGDGGNAAVQLLESEPDELRFAADFAGGGDYVGLTRGFTPALDGSGAELQIRTPATQIGVRVFDSGDQTHQQYLKLSGDPEEWQTITIDRLGGSKDEGFISWGGAGDGVVRPPLKAFSLLVSKWENPGVPQWETRVRHVAWHINQAVMQLESVDPAGLLVPPDSDAPFAMKLTWFPGVPEARQLAYQAVDLSGAKVLDGVAKYDAASGQLWFDRPAATGFYEYELPELAARFGLIVAPDFDGRRDDFFGIDAVFSGFAVFQDEARYRSYLELLRRTGIGWARERMYWAALEWAAPGIDWNSDYARMAERKRQLAKEYGIQVLELFHDAPPWSKREFVTGNYPGDLNATAASWAEIGRRWGACWGALEVWNEPDHGFLPGDHQSAMQKAISYALQETDPELPLVGGVFSGGNTSEAMIGVYVANGLLDDSDAVSFHNYDPAGQLESRIVAFRRAMQSSPKGGMPLVLSECGWPWPSGTPRAAAAADLKSAVYIAMKAVESKACGLASYYPFVFTYYDEGVNNFGMMDLYSTPMRSMAAYLQTVRLLSGLTYRGDLADTGCERARVFGAGERLVAVLYRSPDRPGPAALPPGVTGVRAWGLDGRELTVDTALQLTDHLAYIELAAPAAEALQTATTAMELQQLAAAYRPVPRVAAPVVWQGFFAPQDTTSTVNGYFPLTPARTVLTLRLTNLARESETLRPELTLPTGATVIESGLPAELVLAGGEAREFAVTLDLSRALEPGRFVTITGRDANRRATDLVLPVSLAETQTANAVRGINEQQPFQKINPDGGWFYWGEPVANHRIAGEFRWFYEDDALILDVRVTDPTFHQPFAALEAWKGDSVQIAVQKLNADGRAAAGSTEIVAAEVAGQPVLFRFSSQSGNLPPQQLTKSTLEFSRDGNQQNYRIRLHRDDIEFDPLRPPATYGASFLINSNDLTGRVGYLQWGGGIGAGKNPQEFNRVKLVP